MLKKIPLFLNNKKLKALEVSVKIMPLVLLTPLGTVLYHEIGNGIFNLFYQLPRLVDLQESGNFRNPSIFFPLAP